MRLISKSYQNAIVRHHCNDMAWNNDEFRALLIKALIYKAVGKIIIATAIVLAMALANKYLG